MNLKVYIAGKITGIEEEAFNLFEERENYILKCGHEVINPMKLPHNHGKEWEEYMKECISALMTCNAIYVLDNFRSSKGAQIELELAMKLNFTIFMQHKPDLINT